MTFKEQIERFVERIKAQTLEDVKKRGYDYKPLLDIRVNVKPGKKYIKVDVGDACQVSGKFMIDFAGNIFGIKAYGVINKKKNYGNIDSIDGFYWGRYAPERIKNNEIC